MAASIIDDPNANNIAAGGILDTYYSQQIVDKVNRVFTSKTDNNASEGSVLEDDSTITVVFPGGSSSTTIPTPPVDGNRYALTELNGVLSWFPIGPCGS